MSDEESTNKYIIVVGNPLDGFHFYGPFDDPMHAETCAYGMADCFIAGLHTPAELNNPYWTGERRGFGQTIPRKPKSRQKEPPAA